MERDTLRALGEIHGSSTSLINQMLEIQKHRISRQRAEEWASHLRFLCIPELPSEESTRARKRPRISKGIRSKDRADPSTVLRLSDRSEHPGEFGYVAVSYRWTPSAGKQKASKHNYSIQTSKGTRPSKVSSAILDRVIRFARAKDVKFIWIDQECIDQDDPEDKEVGIQSMDLVYRNSEHPVGLLNVTVESESLSRLQDLLYGNLLVRKHTPKKGMLEETVDAKMVSEVFDVLHIIQSDDWWTRTWIYQEEYCASARMCLLVGHAEPPVTARKSAGVSEDFEIRIVTFRNTVTKFCMACDAAGYAYDPEILDKATEYKVLNKSQNDVAALQSGSQTPHFQSMSPKVLHEIDKREGENVADRLAIFANCSNYSVRLDTINLTKAGYGLSACILALYLLNGEIIDNEPSSRGKLVDPMSYNVPQYLERFSFSEFRPVGKAYQLSQIKDLRLVDAKLTLPGVETNGWLWEIYSEIDLTRVRETFTERLQAKKVKVKDKPPPGYTLNDELMRLLASNLASRRHSRLAKMIRANIESDRRGDFLPRKDFMDRMVEAVIHQIVDHGKLSLGRIVGEREPCALFITRFNEHQPFKKTLGFTGWDDGNGEERPKFVSLEVRKEAAIDEEEDDGEGPERLYTKTWLNGLWFASKRSPRRYKRYVFPWQFRGVDLGKGVSQS